MFITVPIIYFSLFILVEFPNHFFMTTSLNNVIIVDRKVVET